MPLRKFTCMKPITENHIEQYAISELQELGYQYVFAPSLNPSQWEGRSERESYEQIVLIGRLRDAVARINPDIPDEAREQAIQKVLRIFAARRFLGIM